MSRKKVLIITYYWPPASSPGVQRWLKFAKYLPELGWDPIILTTKDGSYPNIDHSLLNDIPKDVKVFRTKSLEPFRLFNILTGQAKRGNTTSVGMGDIKGGTSLVKKISAYVRANLFIPDARKGWVPFALRKAYDIIEKEKIDFIITTGPPHSTHQIGLSLKHKFNLPWLVDLRDPWSNIYYNKFLPRTQKTIKKDSDIETTIVRAANVVSVVSNGLKVEFEERANRIIVLPNGYDEDDFEIQSTPSKKDAFVLSYIGNFKVNQNCPNLWIAVKELCDELEDFATLFRISFTGNIHDEIINSINEYGIKDIVQVLPFVKHNDAVLRMINSDALLFIIPNSTNNNQIITGKIFEYLASRTPLLSIGPVQGDASEILRISRRSTMIDYSEKDTIKERIRYLFNSWRHNESKSIISDSEHEQFSRKNLSKVLVELLEEFDS